MVCLNEGGVSVDSSAAAQLCFRENIILIPFLPVFRLFPLIDHGKRSSSLSPLLPHPLLRPSSGGTISRFPERSERRSRSAEPSERASERASCSSFIPSPLRPLICPSFPRSSVPPFLRSVRSAQGKGSNAESVLNYCRSLRIIVAVFATLFYEVCPRLVRTYPVHRKLFVLRGASD